MTANHQPLTQLCYAMLHVFLPINVRVTAEEVPSAGTIGSYNQRRQCKTILLLLLFYRTRVGSDLYKKLLTYFAKQAMSRGPTKTSRSTGTVHTSAKARLTSIAIRVQTVSRSPPKFNLCSLAHRQSSLKISCKSVQKFLQKSCADRQTITKT